MFVSCRPLLEGSPEEEGAWDGEIGAPSAVPMAAGRYRLYYSGRRHAAASNGTSGSAGASGRGSGSSGKPWEGFGLALTPAEASGEGQVFEGLRIDFQRLVPKQSAGS